MIPIEQTFEDLNELAQTLREAVDRQAALEEEKDNAYRAYNRIIVEVTELKNRFKKACFEQTGVSFL